MKTNKHMSVSMEVTATVVIFIKDFPRALSWHNFYLFCTLMVCKKMPDMSGKHRTYPRRDEKTSKLILDVSKFGRRNQTNCTKIAEVNKNGNVR